MYMNIIKAFIDDCPTDGFQTLFLKLCLYLKLLFPEVNGTDIFITSGNNI